MSQTMRLGAGALFLLVAAGCLTDSHPIPNGIYLDSSGEERIVIHGSEIRFDIRVEGKKTNGLITRTYNYTVEEDGTIVPYVMTSTEAALGIGRYDWVWDGEKIVRVDRSTKESLNFLPDL